MRKVSVRTLLSCLLGEFITLLSFLFLTGKSNYYWIGVGVASGLLIVTFYFGISKIYESFLNWTKHQNEHEAERLSDMQKAQDNHQKELYEKLNSINDSYLSSNESIRQNIETVTKTQSEVLESNRITLDKISQIVKQIEDDNKKVCEGLSEQFIKNNNEINKQHMNELEKIFSKLSLGIETLTNKYNQALDKMSERQLKQIKEWKSGMDEILDTNKREITDLVKSVERKILENSDLSRCTLETNITNTQNAVTEIISETKKLLSEQYAKLDGLYMSFSQNTESCSHQIMEQMLDTTRETTSLMRQSCENTLEKIVARLVEENQQTGQNRTKAFISNMHNLETTYDKIIGEHIKSLEAQVLKSVEHFIAENKESLDSNNRLASSLISSEQSFVSEIEKNNGELKNTISSVIEECNKTVEKNILDMKNVLTASISAGAQSTNNEIIKIAIQNSESITQLAEKLRIYSDSLVEKSAIAIADVQVDNNTKLQEVCKQVAEYISRNANFIQYCEKLNDSLKDKISHLVEDRICIVGEMKKIADEQLSGMDDQMKERIKDLVEKIQNLNIENAEAYNKTMIDYREKLVEANAKAISEVQADNVNSITNANEKVSQLAENLKQFQDGVVGTLGILQSIIDEGIKEQQVSSEEFESSMSDMVDDKLTDYNKKLQEYNDTFALLGEKINEVLNECHTNTANYENTLKFIIDAQKEANSLSSQDIQLLKNLMKR